MHDATVSSLSGVLHCLRSQAVRPRSMAEVLQHDLFTVSLGHFNSGDSAEVAARLAELGKKMDEQFEQEKQALAELKTGQAKLKEGQRRLAQQMREQFGALMQSIADLGMPQVPRLVVVVPKSSRELLRALKKAQGLAKRATALKKYVTSKAKVKKYMRILILDEGPTLPDLDHDAIDALMGGPEANGSWGPINDPGWEVSLPGKVLVAIAPVMMVMAKVLPLIVKAATGLSLPDLGMGGAGSEQIAVLSTARLAAF